MENNHFDLKAKRRMLYKRKKIRKLLKLSLTSFFSLAIVIGIASSYIKNNTNITTLNKDALKNKISSQQETKKTFKVCIDPGHGDEDIGTEGINGSYEKDIVLNIGLELGKLLKENNIDVVYTRIDDNLPWCQSANDSLKERLKVSKISNVDVFISIHCNSDYTATDAKGIETWYKNGDDASYTYKRIVYLCGCIDVKSDILPEVLLVSRDTSMDMDKSREIIREFNKRLWEKKLLR